jgi:hypothetical protein
MLGKRVDVQNDAGAGSSSDDWREGLDRIHQLYQKRRPWTSNFKVFLEKELSITIGQSIVNSNKDTHLKSDGKYIELLDLFNKKQARLASEVVGEELPESHFNAKLDITNASTTVEDIQTQFFITPTKLEDSFGPNQYEMLLAQTMASITNKAEVETSSIKMVDERRSFLPSHSDKPPEQPDLHDLTQATAPGKNISAANFKLELPLETPEVEATHPKGPMLLEEDESQSSLKISHDNLEASEVDPSEAGGERLLPDIFSTGRPGAQQLARPDPEESISSFKRIDSFDLLTDTDLEGFIFEKEDYRKLFTDSVEGVRKQLIDDGYSAIYL